MNTNLIDGVKMGVIEWQPLQWSFSFDVKGCVQFYVDSPPNAFYRFMQRKFLGIQWELIK